jgi:transposase-like protein
MRNPLTRVTRSAQEEGASLVRSIFAQPSAEEAWAQHGRVVEQRAEAAEDILAFTPFPKSMWRRIWSNNPQERLNREVRRRT